MPIGQSTVSWVQNPEADLAGYIVTYGPAGSLQPYSVDVGLTATPTAPSVTLTNLQIWGRVFFRVYAYDNAVPRNVSLPSSAVSTDNAPALFPMIWP